MRIGIDATPLPPRPVGAGNYIIQLTRAFARTQAPAEFVIFTQRHGLPLLRVQERPGFQVVVLPDRSPAARLLWEQMAFPALAARHKLDLLHSLHYTMPLAYRGRTVVTFHDMTFFLFPGLHTLPKRYFFRLFIHLSQRRATALIADSESTRQDAIRLAGVPPGKIHTALLGITPDFHPESNLAALEAVRQKYHLPERFLLFVGLLEPRKNLPALLQAFAGLPPQQTPVKLVVVGRQGWMYEQTLQLVHSLGLAERVHFTGYVDQADVPRVYNLAEIAVYPSRYEGFGFPVLEAMASGTPVITSNVSSMPEIAGEAGVLLPPDDIPALTQAIQRLLSDPAERQGRIKIGLERAAQFTWERTAEKTLQVYHHCLNA
ncbi:MAG: glycosyltransferase family 4 protein [Anaerolineales bacterium]|nr:glycosyltransferase family 4 protein [Anaerolineales bacterium]